MKVTVARSAPYRVRGFHRGRYGLSQYTRRDYTAHVGGKDFENTNKGELQSAVRRWVRKLEDEAGFLHVPVEFEFVDVPDAQPARPVCRMTVSHNSHGACPGVDFPRDFDPSGSYA